MDPIIIAIICAAVTGSGGVALKQCLNFGRHPQEQVQIDHNLEQVIGNILEEQAQRTSEDSDTEIKINIHTHHKPKE